MRFLNTRRRKIAAGSILFVLLLWLLWPDRSLARVRSLRAELADTTIAPEARDAKAQQLRDAVRALTPAQRNALFAEGRQRGVDQLERYAQMSPAEKKQYLDEQIKRQEEFRQRMQQQQPGQANNGPRPGGGPGGPAAGLQTPEDRERRRQQRLDNSTPRERELRDQMRRDMESRRKERGLPPPPPGGRGR